jgi:uncharacterized protein
MKAAVVSPYARVRGIAPGAVRWTRGFWADRFEVCHRRTIPALMSLMDGTERSHYLENFRIAAGLKAGRHRGAPFNDGDFYKLLEAACATLAVVRDLQRERWVEDAIGIIGKAQRGDGYLHTKTLIRQRNGDPDARPFQEQTDFELYNMGHLLTAACVHHQVTGRDTFLAIARKTADFLDETFRRPTSELARFSVCPSHYMGTVDLYRTTGDARYRDLAKRFLDLRDMVPPGGGDDNQDRIPFRQQREAIGHAVRANYLYAGAADVYAETGDRTLYEPLELIWQSVVQRKMYLTGGCGALYDGASPDGAENQKTITRVHQAYGRNYQLPNQTAHSETCASIGNVLWNARMFHITGEARFMDVVELALYNSVLSGVSLEGTDFFYVNPLRCLDTLPGELRWPRVRTPYFTSFCCPPNVARTIAQVSGYACSVSDAALWVSLYGGSTITTALPNGPTVTWMQETEYPWDGRIRLRLNACDGSPDFSLNLRIPGWAESAKVRVNGGQIREKPRPGTYSELRRTWRVGDVAELELPMPPQPIEAHPLVEETRNHLAVRRGPLVYCLESPDLPTGVRLLDVMLPADMRFTPRHDPGLLGGVTVLEGRGMARPTPSAARDDAPLYRVFRPTPAKAIPIRLIPYFAWGNRGPAEMSVWLPLGWT